MRHLPEVRQTIITEKVQDPEPFPFPEAEFLTGPLARAAARDVASLAGILVHRTRTLLLIPWRRRVLRRCASLDLLHAHFSFVGWDFLWLARRLDLPLIVSFYGFDYEALPRSDARWRQRYRELFSQAHLFITEGEFGRSKLIEMGCPVEKVRVVHLGIVPAQVPVATRRKKPGTLRLIQMATFSEKKGHEVTVHAFAEALERCPEMTLTLVGKGHLRAEIEALIRRLGIAGRVTILDSIAFGDLYPFLGDFHVFVHPSRYSRAGDCEGGAPVVLLDAQATGLPVLSTTHCDIPEEVLHGETGFLVPEGDAAALSGYMERFYLMDDAEYQRFSSAARRHVEEEYDLHKSGVKLRSIYAEVAGARHGRQR